MKQFPIELFMCAIPFAIEGRGLKKEGKMKLRSDTLVIIRLDILASSDHFLLFLAFFCAFASLMKPQNINMCCLNVSEFFCTQLSTRILACDNFCLVLYFCVKLLNIISHLYFCACKTTKNQHRQQQQQSRHTKIGNDK